MKIYKLFKENLYELKDAVLGKNIDEMEAQFEKCLKMEQAYLESVKNLDEKPVNPLWLAAAEVQITLDDLTADQEVEHGLIFQVEMWQGYLDDLFIDGTPGESFTDFEVWFDNEFDESMLDDDVIYREVAK